MKGGGKRQIFYTALCLRDGQKHGEKGYKSASSHYFIKCEAPKSTKPPKGHGCPQCRKENPHG